MILNFSDREVLPAPAVYEKTVRRLFSSREGREVIESVAPRLKRTRGLRIVME